MDQIVIDLSDLEISDSLLGCEVVLLSDQPDSNVGLHPIAKRAGIPAHAVLTSLAASIPRVYVADSLGGSVRGPARGSTLESDVAVGRALA